MNASTIIRDGLNRPESNMPYFEDPLEPDAPDDLNVPATRRGLIRLAMVSAEAGARFQREGDGGDPMAWLLASRRLFHGAAAIEACLNREDFVRALVLLGIQIGLDADPDEMDELIGDDTRDVVVAAGPEAWVVHDGGGDRSSRRLFTSVVVQESDTATVHAFAATMARTAGEAREGLVRRYGLRLAEQAQIFDGFDPSGPLAGALVSEAMADMLAQIASDPASPLADGLEVAIEQRFAA